MRKYIVPGIGSGVIGGIAFGGILVMTGLMPFMEEIANGNSFIFMFVHMSISVMLGGLFGVWLGHRVSSPLSGAALGMAYGVLWWVLGPLLIFPAWLNIHLGVMQAIQAFWGHAAYGLYLGIVFFLIVRKRETADKPETKPAVPA